MNNTYDQGPTDFSSPYRTPPIMPTQSRMPMPGGVPAMPGQPPPQAPAWGAQWGPTWGQAKAQGMGGMDQNAMLAQFLREPITPQRRRY